MKLFEYHIGSLVKTLLFFLIGLFSLLLNTAQAQFTITENFRGQVGPNIIIGDDARLTSGNIDPVGAGWLRLTPDANSKQGYAYINRTFPSTLGVLADFEYKMYRNNDNDGADGISVFLFDGKYGPGTFKMGRYGGALGYGPGGDGNGPQDGLTGGYIGVALDAFGNFSTTQHAGPAGGAGSPTTLQTANSITMRGKTTGNRSTSNPLLARKELTGSDVIDYNSPTSTRPEDNSFYRRVQIEMTPVAGGRGFLIKLRWKKKLDGEFEDLVTYTYNEAPPEVLKIGFGASTGGFNNVHEIRNLVVTTPGNLRVSKMANKDILRTIDRENKITYTVEVNNDTDADLTNVDFRDRITDGAGKLVPTDMFTIESISESGFLAGTSLLRPLATNEFSGTLNLKAKTVGRITVTGTLKKVPVGNLLVNTATALPTDITDQDLENNTSTVKTPVIAEGVDLIVSNTVDDACLNPSKGNTFTVNVANMGTGDAKYGGIGISKVENSDNKTYVANRLEVVYIIPDKVQLDPVSIPEGWALMETIQKSPSTGYTSYVYRTDYRKPTDKEIENNTKLIDNKLLATGISLPPFIFNLKSEGSYMSEVKVRFVQETGTIKKINKKWIYAANPATEQTALEPKENRNNNSASASVLMTPNAPPNVINKIIYYCQGEMATPLEATATDSNFKVVWYSSKGGVPLNNVPTPVTTSVGTITYYVSQSNGSCESGQAEVKVVVLAPPTAGTITGDQEVCVGVSPKEVTSTIATAPNWPTGTKISYRWEKLSPANGASWDVIPAATLANYSPVSENAVGVWKYRRVALVSFDGKARGCQPEAISNEVSITVKNCMIISNPMLRSRARK